MAAVLGGTMRSPLTAVIFALELTHDVNILAPLLLAAIVAHGVTVLTLRRSILTEKVSRRGFHLSREYSVDPLEIIFAREVVRTSVVAFAANATAAGAERTLTAGQRERHEQRLFPVIDGGRRLVGVVTRRTLRTWFEASRHDHDQPLATVIEPHPVVAYDDEPLRLIVFRMAETSRTRLPVVARKDGTLMGMVALTDLLAARARILDAEQRRERVIWTHIRLPFFGRGDGT
jgi:CBS domain-containing protein